MIILSGNMLTQLELIDIVFKYADAINEEEKHKQSVYIHVLEITRDIPEEQRWPEQVDLKFIKFCLLEKGVGRISEIKEHRGKKEKPRIPFHQLQTEKQESPFWWKRPPFD